MYFQNVFNNDFIGVLCLGDRQHSLDFKLSANRNTSENMVNWVDGPYDLSASNKFAIKYSLDGGLNFATVSVTLTSSSSVTAEQVVTSLNNSGGFSSIFEASTTGSRIRITSKIRNPNFKAYIPNIADAADASNTAEEKLLFNKYAPVAEMPSYFERHTIANRRTYTDSCGILVKLTQSDENFVITNYGLSTTPKADYELLGGKSGLFTFTKNTVDGSNRVTTKIEYPAGAVAGFLAKKTTYSYTSSNTTPDKIAEVPYTLTGSDLVTP